jgi:hypothetical protein
MERLVARSNPAQEAIIETGVCSRLGKGTRLVPDGFLDRRPELPRRRKGRRMKSLRWMLITAGALAIGSLVVSLVPDLYRYLKIRAM